MAADHDTLCPYCGTGCGLRVTVDDGRVAKVAGDPHHPVNRGRTCRKPLELARAVHAQDRATTPLLRAGREAPLRPATWDDALGHTARELVRIRAEHGPDAIAFYVSGQLLTEDYYAVNKLAKGFLRTNNVDSNSRLCMSSAVTGYVGAFGADGPPPAYADLALADCLLLLGTNTAACHPIVWSRIRDRQAEGATVVVADPRATPTARAADLHLPVRPGTDLALLNAMLKVVADEGLLDEAFIARHTTGFGAALEVASAWTLDRAAGVTGVPARDIARAAELFGTAGAAMALWSMGANQSAVGTLKNRALINLCLATGNLGRPGCGPLSLTGQPNAMGGRETGGLAHLLPGYRQVEDAQHRAEVEDHWGVARGTIAPHRGLTAVELADALLDGRVKAVLVAATNPVVSLPDGGRVREAFERAELLVVQDCHVPTETAALAHVVLPAAAWPEKEGTMTGSERRVGLTRALVVPPGEARPDWQIYAALARELGFGDAFAWPDAAAVYDEFAALTAGRPCDVSGVSHARLQREGSVQWPAPAAGPKASRDDQARTLRASSSLDGAGGTVRLYTDRRVRHPDGRARFAPTPHAGPADAPDAAFPLTLTSGRLAGQWHTMSRTGKSAALRANAPEPLLELHPDDAGTLRDGDRARVRSRRGEVVLRVVLDPTLPPGVCFAPFHFGLLHAPVGAGALNVTTSPATDPSSGQPELKACAVSVAPATAPAARRGAPRRVVVVGTGMAGLRVAEGVLARDPRVRITMLGEEPGPAYNRINLSKLLAGDCGAGDLELKPRAWYAQHGIDLRAGVPAVAIDRPERTVTDARGDTHAYDVLVLATGSRPFVPPVEGAEHAFAFRTQGDVDAITAALPSARGAVVLGGGLLGLEAAAGLAARGLRVDVVEAAPHLMGRQLDRDAAALLRAQLAARGITAHCGVTAVRIAPRGDAAGAPAPAVAAGGSAPTRSDVGRHEAADVHLADGRTLTAGLVVIAAGVRPETTLARSAGLDVDRGIVVDDQLRAAEHVLAVGECVQHRGTVYGLWAPLAQQADVAAATAVGDPAVFLPRTTATTLKVAGIDLYCGGAAEAEPGHDVIATKDTRRGRYRKLVLDGDRLVGATLLGEVGEARACTAALRSADPVGDDLLDGTAPAKDRAPDPQTTICACNQVTAGEIGRAIAGGGARTLAQVSARTRAATGCGGCARDVEDLLRTHSRNTSDLAATHRQDTVTA